MDELLYMDFGIILVNNKWINEQLMSLTVCYHILSVQELYCSCFWLQYIPHWRTQCKWKSVTTWLQSEWNFKRSHKTPKKDCRSESDTHFHRHNIEISLFSMTHLKPWSHTVKKKNFKQSKQDITERTDALAFLELYCTLHYCNNICTWPSWLGVTFFQ